MSAAVLLSVVAPSAPVKGAKVDARASADADGFGAALDEAVPAETAPEPAPKAKAETVPQPAGEPTSASKPGLPANDTATPLPALAVVLPPPPAVPITFLPENGVASETAASPVVPAVSPPLGAEPAPLDDANPAPAPSDATEAADQLLAQAAQPSRSTETTPRGKSAETPSAAVDAGPADEALPKPDPAAAEQTKPVTPVASDRAREVANIRSAVITPLRPAKPIEPSTAASTAETLPAADGTEAEGAGEALASATAMTTPPGTTRVRDVIDRALARPSAQSVGSAETEGARAEIKVSADAASATATTPSGSGSSIARSPIEIPAAVLPLALVDDALAAPLSAAPTAPEARATDAASTPLLSTLSRAAVETTAQIAAQIVRKLESRSTRFEMALTPDHLGRVDVSLDIDAGGALHATLAFDNPVAATELRARADELRRQLIEAGFTVADDALSFSERDPSAGQGGAFDRESDPRNARAFGAASRLNAEADLSLQVPAWVSLSLTPAGVDVKV
ncbi:flagellar hook-length control protein FliK [Brevundimonas sp. AAP58]|uniref:flagellar hook-length control protein FliK n=1 Tax=Brevundimonas sp. AAP58 TaxID=1523422 RepID=UPI000A40B059|nr:flagellar hook-length control protein FliK [Brevundimonas sp. AAP58]